MVQELAQAIRNLATFGRLTEEDEENLHIILDTEDYKAETAKAKVTTGGAK